MLGRIHPTGPLQSMHGNVSPAHLQCCWKCKLARRNTNSEYSVLRRCSALDCSGASRKAQLHCNTHYAQKHVRTTAVAAHSHLCNRPEQARQAQGACCRRDSHVHRRESATGRGLTGHAAGAAAPESSLIMSIGTSSLPGFASPPMPGLSSLGRPTAVCLLTAVPLPLLSVS